MMTMMMLVVMMMKRRVPVTEKESVADGEGVDVHDAVTPRARSLQQR